MTATIIQFAPYLAYKRWLIDHYNTACRISNRYRLQGNHHYADTWHTISQQLGDKLDRIGGAL